MVQKTLVRIITEGLESQKMEESRRLGPYADIKPGSWERRIYI
jgi:hypothetical protein